MFANFLTVTGQVATLFLMMGVGFVLGRMGRLTEAGRGQMSYLLLYIVTPCIIVDSFLVEATPALMREVLVGESVFLSIYLFTFLLTLLFFRKQPPDARDSLRFGTILGNNSFMGLPLVEAVLGSGALIYGALSMGAFNLISWTIGVMLMGGRQNFSLRRAVVNPGVLGLSAGLVLFFTGLRFPSPIASAISFLGDLNTPLAMVIIGAQLAEADLAACFRQPRLYLASALRLVVVPLLAALLILPLRLSPALYCTVVLLSAVPAAGATGLFAQRFGRDPVPGVQFITLSTLLSIVTLPLFAVLAQALSGL